MQRLAMLSLIALVIAVLVWFLVRPGEPDNGGEPLLHSEERGPSGERSTGSAAAFERGAGAPPRASGTVDRPISDADREPANGASAGSFETSAGARSIATGDAARAPRPGSESGADDRARETAGLTPRAQPLERPPAQPGEEDPGSETPADEEPPNASGQKPPTFGELMSEDQAREIADTKVPDDDSLAPEQREELVDQITQEILDKSEKARRLAGPTPAP